MKIFTMFVTFLVTSSPVMAQYHQYHNPSFYSSPGNSPVVVPPTVITTSPQEHNSSKKSCRESMIDLFLFSVRRTAGDCTH